MYVVYFLRFLNFSGNLQQVQHHSVALSPMTTGPSCAHSLGSLNNMSCGATSANAGPDRPMFDKDFECSVCLDDMRPPVKVRFNFYMNLDFFKTVLTTG